MNIEEFYAADERRRASTEIELGRDWRDSSGVRYELSWVADTGELYVMREPVGAGWEDPFGDVGAAPVALDQVTVAVVGHLDSREALEEVLAGWEQAMGSPKGVEWVAERLRAAGVATAPPQAGPK